MIYNYGYQDGMGEFYITVDGDLCTGCVRCVEACPKGVLEMWNDDYDAYVVKVVDKEKRRISYTCNDCDPSTGAPHRPCHAACEANAISHSW